MPELDFQIEGVEPAKYAASPLLDFQLCVTNSRSDEVIHSILLECQIRIEPRRRAYVSGEKDRLEDLFGKPDRWNDTLQTLLWTHARVNVTEFAGTARVNLPVPCTFDLNVAATKYFAALSNSDVPLLFLFSGTVFYRTDAGCQVMRVSWDKEARFRLPVETWQSMMDHYYPNSAWLCGARDVVDRLLLYKQQHGLATWEQAVTKLLDLAQEDAAQISGVAGNLVSNALS